MKVKRLSLAEASEGVVPKRRNLRWDEKLARDNPELAANVYDWIDQWNAGECRERFENKHALARWILTKIPPLIRDDQQIVTVINERANGKSK